MEQYTLKFEYRKGSLHQNADALSRWPLPDSDEDGEDDFNDIVINMVILETDESLMKVTQRLVRHNINDVFMEFQVQLISFRKVNGEHMQASDNNIQFIINKMKNCKVRPDHSVIKNAEHRIYIKEWNNLLLDNDILWRKAHNKLGNEITQFVVPSVQRLPTMERMHSNLLSGHLMMDKTFARVTDKFFFAIHEERCPTVHK